MRVFVLLLVAAGALSGCASRSVAPVSDQARGLRDPAGEFREVVAGDTLYSIAWEIGRDHREVAAWNGLKAPYTIYPGQKLRLQPAAGSRPARTEEESPAAEEHSPPGASHVAREHLVRRGDTLYGIARTNKLSARDLAAWNKLSAPYRLKPGQKLRLEAPHGAGATEKTRPAATPSAPAKSAQTKTAARRPATESASAGAAASAPSPASAGHWAWPADGPLLARFSSATNSKGIDIGGAKGAPVLAASNGSVVYQGSGLRGYGQLIIVKHSAEFLSAYAHCDRIYVKEGDVVKRGQKIADMGSSGADRVKLHFEIRYRGTPVDPLKHLPRK